MAAIPRRMKALVKEREGVSYTYKDVDVPQPQGDELLVKVTKVALCGSDIALYQWGEGLLEGGVAPLHGFTGILLTDVKSH